MYDYSWRDLKYTKALNRMYDEIFGDDKDVKERRCYKRLRKEFVAKINQEPIMRYDWRWMNVGLFPLYNFSDMCNALGVSLELIDKRSGTIISSLVMEGSGKSQNIPLADFINSLECAGLAVLIDGVEIKPFDFNSKVDTKLGSRGEM